MSAVERAGFWPTGGYAQLNSYENRVFDIRLEQPSGVERVIAKFYRPKRWSRDAILDEHRFLLDLQSEGIFAVAPLPIAGHGTLLDFSGFFVALFPKVLGRLPQEFLGDDLAKVGRTLARIHIIGSRASARHRPELTAELYGWKSIEITDDWIAPEVRNRYLDAAETILFYLEDHLLPEKFIRIHGDCHRGNLVNRENEFYFVDFDDFCNGPEAQDLWMLFGSTSDDEISSELEKFLGGYEELRSFDHRQLALFEPLRGLRIINYASWIANRWSDESFRRLFPQFGSYSYWAEETEALEKIARQLT